MKRITSTVHADLPIQVVRREQSNDPAKGMFHVNLKPANVNGRRKYYRSYPVFKDGFGREVVFV